MNLMNDKKKSVHYFDIEANDAHSKSDKLFSTDRTETF